MLILMYNWHRTSIKVSKWHCKKHNIYWDHGNNNGQYMLTRKTIIIRVILNKNILNEYEEALFYFFFFP